MESKNISRVMDAGIESQSESKSLSPYVAVPQRGMYAHMSLYQIFINVMEQIDGWAFGEVDQARVRDIAKIIAEVYRMPPTTVVHMNGMDIPAEMIAEAFSMLTHEHVEHVVDNVKLINYQIRNPARYLRAALYNAVFELDTRLDNELRAAGVI